MHELRLADGRALVLRRYVWPQFLVDEPDAPAREAAALNCAGRDGLPAPAVVASDPDGVAVGDGVPALLMSRLRGWPLADPDPAPLAALAADLHRSSAEGLGYRYSPWCRATSTRPPAGCRTPVRWAGALEIWRTAEPPYVSRLVHRDFHPGNVLWWRGRPTGVVDWVNACAGPAGIDVATCRWNLARWAGDAAADAFVAAYERLTGERHHPYWDIATVLEDDWDRIDDRARIAEAERFLVRALRRW